MFLPNEDINIFCFLVAEVIDGISIRLCRWVITYGTNILKFNSTAFYSSTGKKPQQNKTKQEKVDENRCCSYSTGTVECFNVEKLCRSTPKINGV